MDRTDAYRFTILRDDPRGLKKLERLKAKVRKENAKSPVKMRVQLRARLGENNPSAHFYRERARMGKRYPYQMIRMEHGSRFDVYVYRR